jgi:hypothetical protein
MKKFFCPLFLVVILLVTFGNSYGVSNRDTEKLILSRSYKERDGNGPYYTFYVTFYAPESYITKLISDGCLAYDKDLRTIEGLLHGKAYRSSGFCSGCKGLEVRLENGKEKRIISVPIKKYFLGVEKTWKDLRTGREDYAYATYKTQKVLDESCLSILRNKEVKTSAGAKYLFKDIDIDEFISSNKIGQIETQEELFRKDSQGRWQ